MPRPLFVGDRITMQHDSRDFHPVRAFRLRVEKAKIGDVVPFVIRRNVVSAWRFVVHIGIEFDGNPHSHSPSSWGAVLAVRPRKWLLYLVIGELVTVLDGPMAFRREALNMRQGLPDHRVKECGAVTADTNRQQGLLSPRAARLLRFQSYPTRA